MAASVSVCGYEHEPLVNPAIKPIMQSLRRIPYALREEVSAELCRLKKGGIIERIESSPWISNLVVVRKKSGAIRLCIDFRNVNKATIPGKYPLPTLEELASGSTNSTCSKYASARYRRPGWLSLYLNQRSSRSIC